MRLTYLTRMTGRCFKELLILTTVCFGLYLVHFWWTTMSLKDAVRWYCKLRPGEYRDLYINLHRYKYKLSPTVCSHQSFNIFIVVQSRPSSTNRRQVIRDTYGSVQRFHGMSIGLVFVLGRVDDSTLQGKITREFEDHNDIVQGNVIDDYAFLNQKHIMAMDWFLKNCQSHFVAKLDDDTFLNPYRLVDYLSSFRKPLPNIMLCKVMKDEIPVRKPTSKWYTPWYQYPFKRFPPFCLGFAYVTTPEVWATLYEASKRYRQMDMDDVYVSAVLGASTDLRLKDIEDLMYDCLQHGSSLDVDALRRSLLVLDRWNNCGGQPFRHWAGIKQNNDG